MSRESDLWVFRRFGTLHLFNILIIQQRLAKLELNLRLQISRGTDAEYGELLPNIQHTLKAYGKPGDLHYHVPLLSFSPSASGVWRWEYDNLIHFRRRIIRTG
jgi:hypothetical protein